MGQNIIHQDRVKQSFFILIFYELYFFVPALLGAFTLYILMHRIMFFLTEKKKWRRVLTALFLMLVSFILILFPFWLLVDMLYSKIAYAINNSEQIIASLKKIEASLEEKFNINILSDKQLQAVSETLSGTLPKILTATFNTLATVLFMYFILYFMLVNGRQMEIRLYEYVPVKDENVVKLRKEVHSMVFSNAIGIPIIAIIQGIVGLIGYLVIGVKDPMFWFVITCITAMLPVVGAALAYVPLALIFFADNQNWQGFFMLIYGFGVIGTVDNIFRFILQKKIGNVHPLITVFGVIVGLKIFGFIGLIFGPLLISLFILLLKIYSSEYIVKQRDAGGLIT
jgi:predicted PurR-regulated permease PerM